jgi:hypothetical protein
MKPSKHVIVRTLAVVLSAGIAACSSHIKSGAIRAGDYDKYEQYDSGTRIVRWGTRAVRVFAAA